MTNAGAEMLVEINREDLKKLCLVALHKSGHLNTGLSLLRGQAKREVFEKP